MPTGALVVVTDHASVDAVVLAGFDAFAPGSRNYADVLRGRDVRIWVGDNPPVGCSVAECALPLVGIADVRVVQESRGPLAYFARGQHTAEDADRLIDGAMPWSANDAPRPYRLYSAAELDALPPAAWVVEDAIPQNGLVGIIGAKGTFKTFVALDLALCVATGTPWHGRRVTTGTVVYVYAEGPFGAKARVDAWCRNHSAQSGAAIDRDALRVWFLPARLPVNNPAAVATLLAEIRACPSLPISHSDFGDVAAPPLIVVIDTVNQNLDGDEDGKGMGGFVAGCSAIRDALGCTVIAVHHTPLGAEDRGRGHSSFDGALDTRLIVSRDAERGAVECTHQRNGPDGWSVAFEAVPVAESLALKASAPNAGQLNGQRRELLDVLHRLGTATYSAWIAATEIKPSSFRKARTWLLAKGYVRQEGRNYSSTASGADALGHQGHQEVTRD